MRLNQIIKVNTCSSGIGTQICNNGKGKVVEIKIRDSTHTKKQWSISIWVRKEVDYGSVLTFTTHRI